MSEAHRLVAPVDTEEHTVGPEIGICGQCGIETFYIHADFQVPLHPGGCTEQMWQDYDAALLAGAPVEPW